MKERIKEFLIILAGLIGAILMGGCESPEKHSRLHSAAEDQVKRTEIELNETKVAHKAEIQALTRVDSFAEILDSEHRWAELWQDLYDGADLRDSKHIQLEYIDDPADLRSGVDIQNHYHIRVKVNAWEGFSSAEAWLVTKAARHSLLEALMESYGCLRAAVGTLRMVDGTTPSHAERLEADHVETVYKRVRAMCVMPDQTAPINGDNYSN